MEKFDNRFGFFAAKAPEKREIPETPFLLKELVEVEPEQADSPQDPVETSIAKAQEPAAGNAATASCAKLVGLLFAPADFRQPVALHKSASPASDWSWDAPAGDTPLSKRAAPGTARARLEVALDRFFAGFPEERAEANAIVGRLLADEGAAILANEA